MKRINENRNEKDVANNQISCHSKLDLESSTLAVLESKTINDLRGRSRIKYGMTSLFNHGGFTLIELLVVVLIIGILAAVAVPQYQKAVYKSRTAEAVAMLRAITNAEEVYYLPNGEYTGDISKLDVEVPTELLRSNNMAGAFDDKYSYGCSEFRCDAQVNNANMPSIQYNFQHIDIITAGLKYCNIVEKNEIAKAICQSMGTVDSTSYDADWFNGKYFILN